MKRAKSGTSGYRHRIAFILPYFGKVPWYFWFFNKSCSYNPDVDFIFLTDVDLPGEPAANIIVVKSSMGEFSSRFTEKLGFEIKVRHPYKLCDLRPAFGLVFSDLIEGYDFWGFVDIDMVFGNIRSLITADMLDRYDIITGKEDYIAGFFTLFRNNDHINRLFLKSKDYRKVFGEPLYYDFDECNWEWLAVMNGGDILALNSLVESITHVVKAAEREGEIRVAWRSMEVFPGEAVWDRGNLFYKDSKTALLCHFIYFKDLDVKFVPGWKVIPERFYMESFYFSRYAPASVAGRLLHLVLLTVRFVMRRLDRLSQWRRWAWSYLFGSRRVDDQVYAVLAGEYRYEQMVVTIFLVERCLHGRLGDDEFRLLHKGAGKFVVAKYKFLGLTNIELDFRLDERIATYTFQMTCAGGMKKYIFFRIS